MELYATSIENFDQGVPEMMAEAEDGGITIFSIMGLPPAEALEAMYAKGDRYAAVLLSVEARMWAFGKDGQSESEGPVDAAVVHYADRTGRTWGATRRFIRIAEGNVKWIDPGPVLMPEEGTTGLIPESMARLVAADI